MGGVRVVDGGVRAGTGGMRAGCGWARHGWAIMSCGSRDSKTHGFCYTQGSLLPVVLSLVHKEAKELLDFLADMLGLAVCLWVISRGCCNFNSEYLAETPHKV